MCELFMGMGEEFGHLPFIETVDADGLSVYF